MKIKDKAKCKFKSTLKDNNLNAFKEFRNRLNHLIAIEKTVLRTSMKKCEQKIFGMRKIH